MYYRSLVEACNEGDISKVRKLLDEGRVSVHDTTEEGESLLSLACSAGYFELAQVIKNSPQSGVYQGPWVQCYAPFLWFLGNLLLELIT